jgi:hypothetical protein
MWEEGNQWKCLYMDSAGHLYADNPDRGARSSYVQALALVRGFRRAFSPDLRTWDVEMDLLIKKVSFNFLRQEICKCPQSLYNILTRSGTPDVYDLLINRKRPKSCLTRRSIHTNPLPISDWRFTTCNLCRKQVRVSIG